jgi:hypothetical protein
MPALDHQPVTATHIEALPADEHVVVAIPTARDPSRAGLDLQPPIARDAKARGTSGEWQAAHQRFDRVHHQSPGKSCSTMSL